MWFATFVAIPTASFPSIIAFVIEKDWVSNFDDVKKQQKHQRSPTTQQVTGRAIYPHADYTNTSAKRRVQQMLGKATFNQLSDAGVSFLIMIVWLPLDTVECDPLAMLRWHSYTPQAARVRQNGQAYLSNVL